MDISLASVVGLIITLVVVGFVLWLLSVLLRRVPMFDPFRQIIDGILVFVAILFVLYAVLGFVSGDPVFRLR